MDSIVLNENMGNPIHMLALALIIGCFLLMLTIFLFAFVRNR